jgi:hypothetical protein
VHAAGGRWYVEHLLEMHGGSSRLAFDPITPFDEWTELRAAS